MLSLLILLKSFFSILLLFAGFYFCGQLISTRRLSLKTVEAQFVFEYVLVGMLFCISLFAIVQTGMKTILLPVPLVILLFYLRKNKLTPVTRPVPGSALLIALGAAGIFYILYYAQSFIGFNPQEYKYSSG